ncbi:MAG: nucleotidyl transferase AbiEii/AbiGii toxin family protein [Oscillospiraceae bacterium]|nr:nucleotidyl transferase AbiEii/AbiGii toxin family protein [Oscillospiraceae bacterium]
MYLHDDLELFKDIISEVSSSMEIDPSIIEKDYYVTVFLKDVVCRQPDIIFKGGTSLSKCYKIINRFSEDIDLNIQCETKPTEGQRKHLKSNIVASIENFGFTLLNPDEVRSRRDFNKYLIGYPTGFNAVYLKQHLIVETAVFFRSYPIKRLTATSFIYDFLLKNNYSKIISEYNLEPFELNVQSAERTMIDKLYALGDYYLSGTINGHSRHIYDIYKLLEIVKVDDELKQLKELVRIERMKDKQCPSANDDVDFKVLLNEIIEKDAYKSDYENITSALLFDKVSYNEAVKSLEKILDIALFD